MSLTNTAFSVNTEQSVEEEKSERTERTAASDQGSERSSINNANESETSSDEPDFANSTGLEPINESEVSSRSEPPIMKKGYDVLLYILPYIVSAVQETFSEGRCEIKVKRDDHVFGATANLENEYDVKDNSSEDGLLFIYSNSS